MPSLVEQAGALSAPAVLAVAAFVADTPIDNASLPGT